MKHRHPKIGSKYFRRDTRAEIRFKLRLIAIFAHEFRLLFVLLPAAWIASTILLFLYYPPEHLTEHHSTLLGSAYITLQMIFFRPVIPFVDDWRLIPFFFGLPVLGFVTIADGLMRLGNIMLQKQRYSEDWQKMQAKAHEDHIIVCGLGNVGFKTIEQLRRFGESVVCIERDPNARYKAGLPELEVPLLLGDARDLKLLNQANLAKAKALIAVTNDDSANLEVALLAKKLKPGLRVVMRVFDQTLAEQIDGSFGIHFAFSPSAIAAPIFAQAAISGDILASFDFADNAVNAVTLRVENNSPLIGMTVNDIRLQFSVVPVLYEQSGVTTWDPPGTTVLGENGKLLMMVDHDAIEKLMLAQQEYLAQHGRLPISQT